MYALVKECQGKKKLKALDLTKAMADRFGEDCDRSTCKAAIRSLVDSGRCIYTYFGGSYIEIPPPDGAGGDT
jgi:hypothetical protein